ncbi:hypothetical protein KI440_03490 [Candidatus Saccharibacteria bacterium TM7i]|nr:hypothetical protein KI440_03490 [Candidatus Saccharibacteria bacterium TM7i]
MAATTMPLTNLLQKLKLDFPHLTFEEGADFLWSPEKSTVTYKKEGDPALLLHEIGHAQLQHSEYTRDVELISMERSAWEKAKELGAVYRIVISDDTVEDHLDTYRDWLHARSTCPSCTAVGYQTGQFTYACPACSQEWRVNEARVCGLRRTKL